MYNDIPMVLLPEATRRAIMPCEELDDLGEALLGFERPADLEAWLAGRA